MALTYNLKFKEHCYMERKSIVDELHEDTCLKKKKKKKITIWQNL